MLDLLRCLLKLQYKLKGKAEYRIFILRKLTFEKYLWSQKPLKWSHNVSDRQQVDTCRAADDSIIHAPVKGGLLEYLPLKGA